MRACTGVNASLTLNVPAVAMSGTAALHAARRATIRWRGKSRVSASLTTTPLLVRRDRISGTRSSNKVEMRTAVLWGMVKAIEIVLRPTRYRVVAELR